MAVNLTPSPSNPGSTTVVAPTGGDPRTAASVSTPLQSLLNMVSWTYGVLTGSIAQTITLLAGGPGVGGVHAEFLHSRGVLNVDGVGTIAQARCIPRSVEGNTATGVHLYDPNTVSEVYMTPFTSAVAAGCVWKIAGAGFDGEQMRFSTVDAINSIVVQSPTGATLSTLKRVNTAVSDVTVRYNGTSGFWEVIREVRWP